MFYRLQVVVDISNSIRFYKVEPEKINHATCKHGQPATASHHVLYFFILSGVYTYTNAYPVKYQTQSRKPYAVTFYGVTSSTPASILQKKRIAREFQKLYPFWWVKLVQKPSKKIIEKSKNHQKTIKKSKNKNPQKIKKTSNHQKIKK